MKKDNFIMYIFLGIIFLMFIFYPINFLLINKGIIKPSFSNFYTPVNTDGNATKQIEAKLTNMKNNINTKLTNYLFLYSEVNQMIPNIKNSFNLYSNFAPMGTNSDNEYIFKNVENDYYILQTHQNEEYIEKNMNNSLKFWNNLSKKTSLYIYLPNRYEFQNLTNEYQIHNMNEYKDEFLNKLDSNIKYDELLVNNEEEYKKLFYATDHHWNSYGALEGYYDICQLLNITCSNLEVIKTKQEYHGSIAKKIAERQISDYFTYIKSDLQYDVLVEGNKAPSNFKPLELKTSSNIYYDYYVGFYNGLYSEVIYDYNDQSKENILIIGDSYAWQIDYIIASHFNKTYVLNPKYLETINIDEYLEKNNITKTLVMMETQTTLFDNYNYNYQAKLGGN